MKKGKGAAAALCVCFVFTAAFAASGTPGGQTDPLVTLSYLNGSYTKQVKDMVDQTVTARKAEMEQSLRNILAGQGGGGAPSSGTFTAARGAWSAWRRAGRGWERGRVRSCCASAPPPVPGRTAWASSTPPRARCWAADRPWRSTTCTWSPSAPGR